MILEWGNYTLKFNSGGLEIHKDNRALYFNRRPMFVTVKTDLAISEFYDQAYDSTRVEGDCIIAEGRLVVPSGSEFFFSDTYTMTEKGLRVERKVRVLKTGDDLGFSTKISLIMNESDSQYDYDCFAPGVWYKQNEFAQDQAFGKDLDCEYFWKMETCYGLPLFAMQNIKSGEMISLSRWAADVTMRDYDIMRSENNVDRKITTGSIGMSKPEQKTLNYLYYGYAVRTELETKVNRLSIDYVYPGADGQLPPLRGKHYSGLDYNNKIKTFQRLNHPVEVGFEQNYTVAVNFGHYSSYHQMMREIWRVTYDRVRDKLFDVDNEQVYYNCMKIFDKYTKKYGDAYGLPFACQLPDMDISSVSFQFGFVGQQPGIGYQLLRYGDKENISDAFTKGVNIIDFWVEKAMTESGLPYMCYNPNEKKFEPYPHYVRMLADGVEAILDAYIYMKEIGDERSTWYDFCKRTADWLVKIQNEDGSFYRSYNTDSSIRMDSKSNTPSVIRFLVQFYLIADEIQYKNAAIKAGEWSFDNAYKNLEYRGGTCDNSDIQDKEAGIYALFGFLALYDLTGEQKWLEGAIGAADYTETWTYAWSFPVRTNWSKHPFNKYSISGQSIITIGGGADVYMAACVYSYYRLYVITNDKHYLDFAEFINKNTRQSCDVDGSSGYIMPGLGHESGNFTNQTLQSQYHWLPWCTFVIVDPLSRLYDTFGVYEIADAQRLSPEERVEKNQIYKKYGYC